MSLLSLTQKERVKMETLDLLILDISSRFMILKLSALPDTTLTDWKDLLGKCIAKLDLIAHGSYTLIVLAQGSRSIPWNVCLETYGALSRTYALQNSRIVTKRI